MYLEQEGCGKPDCRQCRNSREGFARIKGWNDAKERAKMPNSLAEALTQESFKTVVVQIDGYFDGQIKAKEQEIDRLNAQINSDELRRLREKRNALRKEVDELKTARDTVTKSVEKLVTPVKRGTFYFRLSRTGDSAGHYIELVDGKAECKTCQSAVYNKGICWASKSIETDSWNRGQFRLYTTPSGFDMKVAQNKKA